MFDGPLRILDTTHGTGTLRTTARSNCDGGTFTHAGHVRRDEHRAQRLPRDARPARGRRPPWPMEPATATWGTNRSRHGHRHGQFGGTGGTYTQSAGLTNVMLGAKLDKDVVLNGGTLKGKGTVRSLTNNGGIVEPGASPGTLNVATDFIQTAGALRDRGRTGRARPARGDREGDARRHLADRGRPHQPGPVLGRGLVERRVERVRRALTASASEADGLRVPAGSAGPIAIPTADPAVTPAPAATVMPAPVHVPRSARASSSEPADARGARGAQGPLRASRPASGTRKRRSRSTASA